jgi:acyl-[acyl carrier protein]--UDP-N-acetylglucosamine O-acyltransferase
MAERIRKTQEEQVIEMLKREGFRELKEKEIQREPYKSIYATPECFREDDKQAANKAVG